MSGLDSRNREVWLKSVGQLRSKDRIFFGGIWIPWSSAVKHFLVLGATGSGKTMVFDLLAQSMLGGRIGRGLDQRGIWFDAKTEAVPRLAALGVPYKILNPFDRRSVALDIKSMVPTRAAAMELAGILMPEMKGATSDPFWIDSPRNILASVLTSLRLGRPRANGERDEIDFDLRDIVHILASKDRISEVVTRNPETRDDLAGYFDDTRLAANLMATIKTAMMYYTPIAACWHRANEKINLDDCVSGDEEFMLVLGNREESRLAITAINRAIVTRYAQLALARGNSASRRVSFFLDEFADLKRINSDAMKGLLTKGRSKGISVILGIQTLSSVTNEYGPEDANTILSQCMNIAVLCLGDLDSETAEQVMRGIGQSERHEYLESDTPQGIAIRRTTRTQLQSRPVVLSSELTDLPETSKANGLPGYFRTRSTRGWWGAVIPGTFLEKTLTRPAPNISDIEERPLSDHELLPWTPADLARLGLSSEPGKLPKGGDEPHSAKPFRVYRGGKRGEAHF
jgi:type IV secretory pathway TraG/TraD family ATPase VirD4